MSELIKMSAKELTQLETSLWDDWQRVNNALKVVNDMEGEE